MKRNCEICVITVLPFHDDYVTFMFIPLFFSNLRNVEPIPNRYTSSAGTLTLPFTRVQIYPT